MDLISLTENPFRFTCSVKGKCPDLTQISLGRPHRGKSHGWPKVSLLPSVFWSNIQDLAGLNIKFLYKKAWALECEVFKLYD